MYAIKRPLPEPKQCNGDSKESLQMSRYLRCHVIVSPLRWGGTGEEDKEDDRIDQRLWLPGVIRADADGQ